MIRFNYITTTFILLLVAATIGAENQSLFSFSNDSFSKSALDNYVSLQKETGVASVEKIDMDRAIIDNPPEVIDIWLEGERITLDRSTTQLINFENYRYLSYHNTNTFLFMSVTEDDLIADILSPAGTYNIVSLTKNEYALVKTDDSPIEYEPAVLGYDEEYYESQEIMHSENIKTAAGETDILNYKTAVLPKDIYTVMTDSIYLNIDNGLVVRGEGLLTYTLDNQKWELVK